MLRPDRSPVSRSISESSRIFPSGIRAWRSRSLAVTLGCLVSMAASGCDKDIPTLFNENGVWVMVKFDFSGDSLDDVDDSTRKQAMMLKFRDDLGIVQSAFCAESEDQTAQNSTCRWSPAETEWFCRCYAYAFEGSEMAWREFPAGDARPGVSIPAGGADDDDADGDVTVSDLSEVAGARDTFLFQPLPSGLFGSDGDLNRFVFERKANSVFDQALHSDRQTDSGNVERPACEPCAAGF